MTPVISMSGVEKSFGQTRALDQLDLSVQPGEVHGFLGPNGAGKTTTIRILLGLLQADAGEIGVLGGDPWKDATELHRRLAYVPGDVNLWPGLTGGEIIDLLARMRGGIDTGRRADLIERFDLDPKKKARTYSKGNRQKVTLIAALASEVELLVLDEPTSGLDPLMEELFRQVVREEAGNGRTVLLSSHILSEVEALCDRITIIREGRAVETGTIQDMHHLSRTSITARLAGAAPPDLPGAHEVQVSDGQIRCEVDTDRLNDVLGRLIAVGVQNLVAQPPTLEELFLRHYVDRPADGEAASAERSGSMR
ncbi:ABC transporter ATP-binding protein [Actinomadura sp. 7K507]|uniref:ABC transporter ATP-binding protein n=1 Tax=Actinomadura sp. 7K507 TaxID=2530365 RepID=UPI00104D6195|nr:ABC transporter ATP-binding protein [Actinomadura sp. 7K507]TDC77733.1 ABC transporter ATP-binding protein [Actinomadura sp. 7K507]